MDAGAVPGGAQAPQPGRSAGLGPSGQLPWGGAGWELGWKAGAWAPAPGALVVKVPRPVQWWWPGSQSQHSGVHRSSRGRRLGEVTALPPLASTRSGGPPGPRAEPAEGTRAEGAPWAAARSLRRGRGWVPARAGPAGSGCSGPAPAGPLGRPGPPPQLGECGCCQPAAGAASPPQAPDGRGHTAQLVVGHGSRS